MVVSVSPGSTSSLPVENTATFGLQKTFIEDMPTEAIKPMSWGLSQVPFVSRSCPVLISSPLMITFLPFFVSLKIFTDFLSPSVSSIITTASAPGGILAPVAMATVCPEFILYELVSPAFAVPTTSSERGCFWDVFLVLAAITA